MLASYQFTSCKAKRVSFLHPKNEPSPCPKPQDNLDYLNNLKILLHKNLFSYITAISVPAHSATRVGGGGGGAYIMEEYLLYHWFRARPQNFMNWDSWQVCKKGQVCNKGQVLVQLNWCLGQCFLKLLKACSQLEIPLTILKYALLGQVWQWGSQGGEVGYKVPVIPTKF